MTRTHDGPGSIPARTVAVLVMALVLASIAALAVPSIQNAVGASRPSGQLRAGPVGTPEAAQPTRTAGRAGRFLGVPCRATDQGYCDRLLDDVFRRTSLTDSQQAAAQATSDRVVDALPPGVDGDQVCSDSGEWCSIDMSPPPVRQLRRALTAAGYPGAVVRLAQADDPAPPGSVLVAVAVGPACILVIHDGEDREGMAVGRLPDGSCLDA